MPTFSVKGIATRQVTERVEFSVDVFATDLAGVTAAVRAKVSNEDYEELDTEFISSTSLGDVTITETSLQSDPYDTCSVSPTETFQQPTTYRRVSVTAEPTFARAFVETRPNGYSPCRVVHTPR